jgi:3-oxoadipate CoA-transferase, beta subunit
VTATVTTEYPDRAPLSRAEMAELVADDLALGSFVNLGIGLPTTVADYLDPAAGIILHTENGMSGMGPAADGESIDVDLINAGKTPVTEMAGAAYFHHADSFAMMRGGHLDVCVLGAFQASQHGDLANWHTGAPDAVPAVGGAMDLAIGAQGVDGLATYGTSLTELQQRLDLPLGRPRQSGAPCSGPRHRIKAPSGRQH